MQQLGGIDSALVYLESPAMPLHTGGMLIYDPSAAPGGRVTVDEITARVRDRLTRAASFRLTVAKLPLDLDLPYWFDGEVDLGHHIVHDPLRDPGDWRQLCEQAARFLERPLDMRRPLWELCIIDGLDHVEGVAKGSFALVVKLHHAVVDGIAGLDVVAALHDPVPVLEDSDDGEAVPAGNPPSRLSLLRGPLTPSIEVGAGSLSVKAPPALRRPLRLLGVAGGLGLGFLKRQVAPPAQDAEAGAAVPETRFSGPLDGRRTVGGITLEMADVKAIRAAAAGTTVNDVVLATVSGGLRSYLEALGELPADPLISVMPVNVRTADEAAAGGNRFTLGTLSLSTDVADPLERLTCVRRSAATSKAVLQGPAGRALVTIADAVPAGVLGVLARLMNVIDLTSKVRLVNTGVTNVPGPRTTQYFRGAALTAMYGYSLIVPGVGLMHMATGIGDSLTLGFMTGRDMIPDPQRYEECLQQAFHELLDAARDVSGLATSCGA